MNKLSAIFLLLISILVASLLLFLKDAKVVTYCHGYGHNIRLTNEELSTINKDLSKASSEATSYATYLTNTLILIVIHKQWDEDSVDACQMAFKNSLKRLTGYSPDEGIPQRVIEFKIPEKK